MNLDIPTGNTSVTLAQWGERSPLERTVMGSNPGRHDKTYNSDLLIRMSIR